LLASSFTVLLTVNWKIKKEYSVNVPLARMEVHLPDSMPLYCLMKKTLKDQKITASIDATTINTGNNEMNAHAKEALNTALFPVITFVSTSITKTISGYEAIGNLTLKGITKTIKFPFYFDSKKTLALFPFIPKETFNGSFTIFPKDFSITRKGTPDQVTISITIPVTK